MTRAVIIGQSHCAAIAEAMAGECAHVEGISILRLGDQNGSQANQVSLAQAAAIVAGLPSGVPIFLSIVGTYHNILGLLRSGASFDFLLDSNDLPDPEAVARIPHRAVAAAFEENFAEIEAIRKIKAVAKWPIFVLSTPPPKESNLFVLGRLMSLKKKSYRGRSIAEVGVERPETRLKLWALEVSLAERWATSHGMLFLPAPSKSFNKNGFLARKYYAEDATHANGRYGALVVQQICSIVDNAGSKAAHG